MPEFSRQHPRLGKGIYVKMKNVEELLRGNSYPGRGILLGKSANGKNGVIAYFIMGRSENSRNRVFVEDGQGIRTEAFDPAKVVDPSLIIYHPVRVHDHTTIVTNGDQTDTIFEFLEASKSFQAALRTRTFEPDSPNYTPRISGVMKCKKKKISYRLSILKSAQGNPKSAQRFFFEYEKPIAGQGHLIHTYRCDGDPIPSFEGEPVTVSIPDDQAAFTETLWNALNPDHKVSLFVRYIDIATGTYRTRIVNKNVK